MVAAVTHRTNLRRERLRARQSGIPAVAAERVSPQPFQCTLATHGGNRNGGDGRGRGRAGGRTDGTLT